MNTEPNETSASAASEPSAHGPVSPGSLIREARQAARLSVDDLAAHTKLARTTVEALERDDFGALLEPVYVRGYYRKCAKVLNLNEKTLIDAYAARVTQKIPQPPAKLRLASGTELGSSSRLPMTMGILFVIVGVAVCAFLWWVRGATTAVPQILSTPVTTSISDTSGTPVEVTPPPAASGSTAASQAGPDTAAAVPPPAASATPAPAAAAPAVSGDTPAAVVPSPSTATASNVPVVPSGSGPLLVTFTGQSW
ncbi:MAG: helix-turn-helix domain-containing protein, partial [Solimonas sp.]